MSGCCDGQNQKSAKTAVCPLNDQIYKRVSIKTLLHQLHKPWRKKLTGDYYYCDDPECEVIYFNQSGQVFNKDDVRFPECDLSPGQAALVCYCFDVSIADLQSDQDKAVIREFIIEQTANHHCECEVRNPSGTCCLKDFK